VSRDEVIRELTELRVEVDLRLGRLLERLHQAEREDLEAARAERELRSVPPPAKGDR
jgi:hypothetical protein